MTSPLIVAPLYQQTMGCTACFQPGSGLQLPTVDLPQPRWVGAEYEASKPRVLVVMLNPGQGEESGLAHNQRLRTILHKYKKREATYAEVLTFQREHMQTWGRSGQFLRFYTAGLGIKLNKLSFINIALCSTVGNKYPRSMLKT